MIIFFQNTVNYTQGINMLENLGSFQIISNYTILDGICIKAPIKMAPVIAQQNYVTSITYNGETELLPNQITTNQIQAEDTNVDNAIGAITLQNSPYNLTGTGVVVAVLDTGINPFPPYLNASRISNLSQDFTGEGTSDQNGHGTAVASIIGAAGGPAGGVAPNVTFLNLKVLDASGEGYDTWAISAINTAVADKANIISMSFGDSNGTSDDPLSTAANIAWNDGVIVVAAAGNEGAGFWPWQTNYETVNSPGLGAYIITVGSAGGSNYGSVSYFSSRGPTDDNRSKPDIVAPGEGLTVLSNDGSSILYNSFSGTSAATPVVSGAIALLLSNNSNVSWISPDTVKAAIMMTATDLGDNPFSQGAGLINISAAYNYLQDYYITNTTDTPPLIITPIRAITTPMTLSSSTTTLNLTIVVGNVTRTPIINAYFNVSGNASAYTTLPTSNNFTLNDTQTFVQISFTVPPNMSVSNFSGTLNFVNGTGIVLFTIPLSPPSVTPLWIYLLPLLFSSYQPMNLLVIGIVAGTAATVVIAFAAIILTTRRKPEAPPPEFGFEKGEGPPPPPPPTEPEPDWFT
jgi:subtilisin family serine protease